MPVTPFSSTGPSASVQPSSAVRACSSSQIRSSGHARDVLVGSALDVQPAAGRRAQAEQREAAGMVRVDELLARRRHVGEDPEPAVRVLARERPEDGLDRRAADAVEPVAAGDHVAVEAMLLTVVLEADVRLSPSKSCTLTSFTSKSSGSPPARPRGDQVLDDLGLAVDRRCSVRPSARSSARGAARRRTGDGCRRARSPRRASAPDPGAFEQLDRSLLEHPGPDRASTYSRLRSSSTTDSMPARCSSVARMSPAGPAPTIATCARRCFTTRRAPAWRLRMLGWQLERHSRSPTEGALP